MRGTFVDSGCNEVVLAQSHVNSLGNFLRDFVLKSQKPAEFAIILPRPQMRLVPQLNELGGNADFVRITTDATLDHVFHSKFAPYLLQGFLRVLIVHDRRAGDHSKMLGVKPPELRDHFLRQTVAEVVLTRVPSQIFEGQNCDHGSSARSQEASSRAEPLNGTC